MLPIACALHGTMHGSPMPEDDTTPSCGAEHVLIPTACPATAQKLHLCSYVFDFTDPSKHVREKEIKRQTLLELVDYANSGSGKFTEAVSEDIIFMLSQNLFRTLPPSRSHDVDNFDPEEEEPALEPAWPHLQVKQGRCL